MKFSSSGGSGASSFSFSPVSGCTNASFHACRNMRFIPCLARRLFNSKSPYLSSPTMGNPRCGEMHADLVRAPGLELRLQQTVGAAGALEFEHGVRLAPFIVDADAALARAGDIALQLQFDVLFARRPLALHQYQVALVHLPSRESAHALP